MADRSPEPAATTGDARPDAGREAIVVMGPSGTGKTTTAKLLAERTGWDYSEADAFHPASNIEKMSSGEALNDEDRQPWLEAIRDHITAEAKEGRPVIVACSALKRKYRDTLRAAESRVRFLSLVAESDVIADRMAGRSGHFMPPSLLKSQYETLQPLEEDEDGISVSVLQPPEDVVAEAIDKLGLPLAAATGGKAI